MSDYSLFINGVYDDVLRDILAVQSVLPEQILFLQPYAKGNIAKLAENSPTVEKPVRVFFSLTNKLNKVCYTGKLVGWHDKQALGEKELMVMNRLIYMFQRTEAGVYMDANEKNLLSIWRLKKLSDPFSVSELIKISDNSPLSTDRTTSGGWSYVQNVDSAWLEQYL
jgi:hypothetical protein